MNNDRGRLRGFTHILVPGGKKQAEWSLSGECHKIHGGKYYKSCLMGKHPHAPSFMRMSVNIGLPNRKSFGFMDTMWMCELWHTNTIPFCVNEQERQREGNRKITNPVDALVSQGRGQSQPQGFTTLDGGRHTSPRLAPTPRVMHGKGISVKHTTGQTNQKQAEIEGTKEGGGKTINKSTWICFTRRALRSLHLCSVT